MNKHFLLLFLKNSTAQRRSLRGRPLTVACIGHESYSFQKTLLLKKKLAWKASYSRLYRPRILLFSKNSAAQEEACVEGLLQSLV